MNPHPDTTGLRPFAKGESGNPGGRPSRKPITDRLRAALEESGMLDKLKDQWLAMIADGDASALRELLARVEGKVTDKVHHEGELTIRVVYDDGDRDPNQTAEAPPGPGEDSP